jgi:tetratricopeptide (TPR) repeat protein
MWWLEWRLWGTHAAGYHAVSVGLHAINAVLIWMVLRRLKIPGAWFAALVFAVHPVTVVTVAWISEQKNILSMFFYAMAILLYLEFDEKGSWRWYGFSLAAFVLALLSKTAVVMTPFVLLGCVWWLHGSMRPKDILRVGPFFGASLVLGMATMWVHHHRALVMGGLSGQTDSFLSRVAGAGDALWFYVYKAFWPVHLSMIYPKWGIAAFEWSSYWPTILAVGCLIIFWWRRNSWGRPLLFSSGYFAVMLFPVLGFFYISFHEYSWVADHWQYHALIGMVALAVAAGAAMYRRTGDGGRWIGLAASMAVVAVLVLATRIRASNYGDSESLWRDTVARNPQAWAAHYNLGNAYFQTDRLQDAIGEYQEAVRLKPGLMEAQNNLAFALLRAGQGNEGVAHLQAVLQINPRSADAHYNLGNALVQAGRVDDAMGEYQQAALLKPDFAEAHEGLAMVLVRKGQVPEAISEYLQALRYRPDYPEALNNLGLALASQRKFDEAIAHIEEAVRVDPDYADAHYNLAALLAKQGRIDEAISQVQSALKLVPNSEKFQRALGALQQAKGAGKSD